MAKLKEKEQPPKQREIPTNIRINPKEKGEVRKPFTGGSQARYTRVTKPFTPNRGKPGDGDKDHKQSGKENRD